MTEAGAGGRCASVAVPVPVRRLFTYLAPAELEPDLAPGVRVRVPFGARRLEGTVVAWPVAEPDPPVELKQIEAVLPGAPILTRSVLELTRFVADYYLCSWGEAIEAALPPRVPAARRSWMVRRLPGTPEGQLGSRATAQRELLDALPRDGTPLSSQRLGPAARRAVGALIERGWVERVWPSSSDEASNGPPSPGDHEAEAGPVLTPDQDSVLHAVVASIESGRWAPFVLFGVTGSGKTEVYLRAARAALDAGRSVLYLVPEIGLTPLLVDKISRRFPGQIAVMHSGLPARRRREAWESVRVGRTPFVIGTRSAVFAPLQQIGLIVVDEEHDGSYKQEETPRYNGRDLAVLRARTDRAVIVMGSATPSLESFHHARVGRYGLLRLPVRISRRAMPTVTVVDMRREFEIRGEVTPVSEHLIDQLQACIERGEQALVLRNRRGWSVALLCPRCGNRITCRHCSISLTWHQAAGRLRCHYCALQQPRPRCCPECSGEELNLVGEGTEQVEDLLREALPGAVIARMDRDSIRKRGAHEALLRRFDRGEIDVLVGTQMIAKGHDFPRVTLVGVLSADHALGLPDFRSAERTFQLLTQVAGRAGRGSRDGVVVVQAFDTGHPVLRLSAVQDYEAFYEREIGYRRALRYPPVSALIEMLVSDPDELQAREWAGRLGRALRECGRGRLLISGPGPAPVERLRGRYRQQLLARSAGRRRLIDAAERALAAVATEIPRRAISVDVDPLSIL